jgi:hypothetical protein
LCTFHGTHVLYHVLREQTQLQTHKIHFSLDWEHQQAAKVLLTT